MDITTILNRKASVAMVAAADTPFHQFESHDTDTTTASALKSEPPSAADHAALLSYPTQQHLASMRQQETPHSSSLQPSGAMPLMQNPYFPGGFPSAAQIEGGSTSVFQSRPAASSAAPKTYLCSTCTKAFARRSDLARHGENNTCRLL